MRRQSITNKISGLKISEIAVAADEIFPDKFKKVKILRNPRFFGDFTLLSRFNVLKYIHINLGESL